MFFAKRQRELDKEIMTRHSEESDGTASDVISVNINDRSDLYSKYSYDGQKLKPAFAEHLYEECKSVPFTATPKIKIHSAAELDVNEINHAVKNYFRNEYADARKAVSRNTIVSLIMALFGIVTLSILFAIHYIFDNAYITTVLEIAAWVFIWESVDCYFLRRPRLKAKCILIQKIYSAEFEVTAREFEAQ